jgi:hypothetical protein
VDRGPTAVDSIKADQRVNLEVGKMKVNIYGVESVEEVDESILLLRRDVFKESGSDFVTIGERPANMNVQLECLGVNITNIDTTFVGEEDSVTLALGCDADIIFCA